MAAQSSVAKLNSLERRLNAGLRAYGSTPSNSAALDAQAAAQRTRALVVAEIARRAQDEVSRAAFKEAQKRENAETWLYAPPPRTPPALAREPRAARAGPRAAAQTPRAKPRLARRPMYPTAAQRHRAKVAEAVQWDKLERATLGLGRNPRRAQNDRTRAAIREFRGILQRARRTSPGLYRELTAGQRRDTLTTRVPGGARTTLTLKSLNSALAKAPAQKPRRDVHREARRLGVGPGDVARLLQSSRRVLRTRASS